MQIASASASSSQESPEAQASALRNLAMGNMWSLSVSLSDLR